ncbi:MAG TPA: hypothetical protein VLA14_11600 [Polyangia bacterium]|nr:hypothetical protein [Polyangia bacterium]
MTRQGLRDLNYYGPKRVPATAGAPVPIVEPTVAPAAAPVAVPVSAEPASATPKDEQ